MSRPASSPIAPPHAELLTRRQAAELLGLTTKTLAQWHWRNLHTDVLPVLRVGNRDVRYRRSDVMRIVEQGFGTAEGQQDGNHT